MSELTISVAHNNLRLAASIAYADTGALNSRIRFYDASDNLLVTMVLAKPCGTIVSNKLALEQNSPTGDQITAQGSAHHAEWINGNGDLVGSGLVTFEGDTDPVTSLYPFKVAGTTGTLLYAGAYAILGTTELE